MRAFFDVPDVPRAAKPKRRRCWECGRRAEHEHHVIPKVLGGKRTVPLCGECHAKVHGRRLASSLLIRAGQAAAKAKGVKLGRRRKVDVESAKSLRGQGVSVGEIAERFGCSKVAVYGALR